MGWFVVRLERWWKFLTARSKSSFQMTEVVHTRNSHCARINYWCFAIIQSKLRKYVKKT